MDALVSVIVPAYNAEKTCHRSIESVLAQTYPHFEVVLVDDGSKDDTFRVCTSYAQKDARIRLIHQENGGVSKARNTGLDHAQGKYVAFVDVDDSVEPDFLQAMVASVQQNSSDLAVCGFTMLSGGQEQVWLPDNSEDLEAHMVRTGGLNTLVNKLFRRELIDFRFNEASSMGEDLEFVLNYYQKVQTVSVVKKSFYLYYMDTPDSLMKKNDLVLDSIVRDVLRKEQFLSSRGSDPACAREGTPRYLFSFTKQTGSYREFVMLAEKIRSRKDLLALLARSYPSLKDRIIAACLLHRLNLPLYLMGLLKK